MWRYIHYHITQHESRKYAYAVEQHSGIGIRQCGGVGSLFEKACSGERVQSADRIHIVQISSTGYLFTPFESAPIPNHHIHTQSGRIPTGLHFYGMRASQKLLLLLSVLLISRSMDLWKMCISSLCSIDKLPFLSISILSVLL